MVFILIALLSIVLYILDYKIPALLLFFFFITSGFNLISEETIQFLFISKGMDYAFVILFGIVGIDILFVKKYLKLDNFVKYLIGLASFLVLCILYSKYIVGLDWADVIRACRYQFFWVAYLVFRNMEKQQLESLLKYLFLATVFTSVLFLLQLFIGENILVKTVVSSVRFFGIKVPRFYNQPDMIQFFSIMAIFCNPYKGFPKYLTLAILVAALWGAFHRSWIGCSFLTIGIGYTLSLPRLKRVKILTIAATLLLFFTVFEGYKLVHSRTYLDLKTVLSGDVSADVDIDMTELLESTFTFRIAHLLERNQYLLEHPKAMFFGAGLMAEDAKNVGKMFDFKVGLMSDLTGNVAQLDTGDISYSILLLKFGYLGTFLFLFLFVHLMVYFYRKRDNKYALASFLYFVMAFGIAFFSNNFVQPVAFLLPLISYCILKKTDIENVKEEI
jgi:hypothetical protein